MSYSTSVNTNTRIEEIKEKLMAQGNVDLESLDEKAREIIDSIYDFAQRVEDEKEEKKVEYDECMAVEKNIKEEMRKLEMQYGDDSPEYINAAKQYSEAELNTDIARGSFNSANSYAHKMNTQAIMASSYFMK